MSRALDQLIQAGLVEAVPILLGPRDHRFRWLYWTREFSEWCTKVSKASAPPGVSLASPAEQLNQAFADFVAGRPLTGMTKCDPPKGQGIWRLKTPDLRLYGWADEAQVLILARGEYKHVLKAPGPPKDRHMGSAVASRRRSWSVSTWVTGEIYDVFPRATR